MLRKITLIMILLFVTSASVLFAEEPGSSAKSGGGNVKWAVVPGPFYNPNLGWGIQILPLASYPLNVSDKISPPSVTAGFFLFAKPDWDLPEWTFIGGLGQKFYWNQDDWRVNINAGGASVLFKQYLTGNEPGDNNLSVWAVREGFFSKIGVKRRIWNRLYGGLNYSFQYYRIRGRTDIDQSGLDLIGFTKGWQFQSMPGVEFYWDSRDNQFSATKGIQGSLKADFGTLWLGGDNSYTLLNGLYSQYYSFDPASKHLLAWAYQFNAGLGDVPRDKYSTIGGGRGAGLRGYISGEFEDKSSMEAQIEYRLMVTPRFGGAVFAGVGTIYGEAFEFMQGPYLPAGGFGIRIAAIPERRINARLDFAWGIDSFSIYFALGEAF